MTLPAPEQAADVVVSDDPERTRYVAHVGNDEAGFATYHRQPGLVTVLHTEIDPAFEGRGVGSALVQGLLDDVRRREERVLPICPFVKAFLQRHPEHAELVWKP